MKFIGLKRIGGTFALMFYDEKRTIVNSYFIQFSLKDMWKCPHREERFDNGSYLYDGYFSTLGR